MISCESFILPKFLFSFISWVLVGPIVCFIICYKYIHVLLPIITIIYKNNIIGSLRIRKYKWTIYFKRNTKCYNHYICKSYTSQHWLLLFHNYLRPHAKTVHNITSTYFINVKSSNTVLLVSSKKCNLTWLVMLRIWACRRNSLQPSTKHWPLLVPLTISYIVDQFT